MATQNKRVNGRTCKVVREYMKDGKPVCVVRFHMGYTSACTHIWSREHSYWKKDVYAIDPETGRTIYPEQAIDELQAMAQAQGEYA